MPYNREEQIRRVAETTGVSYETARSIYDSNQHLRAQVQNRWFVVPNSFVDESFSPLSEPESNNDMDPHDIKFKEKLKQETKKRHLNSDERRRLHKPLSDILPDEIPRRACDLKFDDIVSTIQ